MNSTLEVGLGVRAPVPATPPAAPRTEHTPPRAVKLPELRVSENRRFLVQVLGLQEGWKFSQEYSVNPQVRPQLNTDWQHVTMDFVRKHESITMIYLHIDFADVGTVWIDDCTLARKDKAASSGSGPTKEPQKRDKTDETE